MGKASKAASGLVPPPRGEAGLLTYYSFNVRSPLPRRVPYVFARRGPYVTTEAKEWREAIAKACRKAKVKRAPEGWTWKVTYEYKAKLDHADFDSLTHSAQDAVSKDYLRCVDKEFYGEYRRNELIAASGEDEAVHLEFRLFPKAGSLH